MREWTPAEREILRTLKEALLEYVPEERFCFAPEERDGCMVLAPGEGEWYVFFREGRLIEDVTVHTTLEDAARQLIQNVAPSPEAQEAMQKRFSYYKP